MKGLSAQKIIVGDDFRFAKNREGNYKYLLENSQEKNFEVFKTGSYIEEGIRVSSTLIRDALAQGDITKANHYLGRPYTISGRVTHGDKRGKTLGFPTINIELHRNLSPVSGIFAGYVHGVDDKKLGAAVIGGPVGMAIWLAGRKAGEKVGAKFENKAKKNKVIFEILDAIVNINSISDPVVAIWKIDQIISLLEFFV